MRLRVVRRVCTIKAGVVGALLLCMLLPVMAVDERPFLDLLVQYVPMNDATKKQLYDQADTVTVSRELPKDVSLLLFDTYPALRNTIPYLPCADLPTPIEKMDRLGAVINCPQLYIKRDDVTGLQEPPEGERRFGGNKVRKLGFLLGDALQRGARSVLTFGGAGSNHAVATASCAQLYGLHCMALLKYQPNSHVVRRNLMLMHRYGALMLWSEDNTQRHENTIVAYLESKERGSGYPYPIPTGGSCPLGTLGFVNAAFELAKQVQEGVLPEPDDIYTAAGSFGTAAGLMVGCRLAGLNSRIIAVTVEPEDTPGDCAQSIAQLCNATLALLRSHDENIPAHVWQPQDVTVNSACSGSEYGLFTPEGVRAALLIREHEGIHLDGTYTGKACAALCRDGNKGCLKNKVVLFWDTFCGYVAADHSLARGDVRGLPTAAREFLTLPVQPLDDK